VRAGAAVSADGYFAALNYRLGGGFRFEAVLRPYVALDITFVSADGSETGPERVLCSFLVDFALGLVERRDVENARAVAHQWIALEAVRLGTMTPAAANRFTEQAS
jgi:hypothetical protein